MNSQHQSRFPKLHNAMWPGLVGKGSPGAEPCLSLDQMLELTANAQVNGNRFDGVDLFLFDPHVSIDSDDDALKRLADKIASKGFVVGSVVAPVWAPTGGGSAMGSNDERARFIEQVRKACRIARRLRDLGIRPYGVVRIDSASSVEDWARDPEVNQAKIAETFSQACDVAESFGERLAAEGEICWGGMHSWRRMAELLDRVNRPATLGFQADMAHTLLYTLGYNQPEDALLPPGWDWSDPARLDDALRRLTAVLRPWTIDFHVAQNDATVHGSGTHDKTGHHCLPGDPNGKLRIAEHAGFWLRGPDGAATRRLNHICWDGCMFPNSVMLQPDTWNGILATMIAVRDAHGWSEPQPGSPPERSPGTQQPQASVSARPPAKAHVQPAKPRRATRSKPKAKKGTLGRKVKRPVRASLRARRAKATAAPAPKPTPRRKTKRRTGTRTATSRSSGRISAKKVLKAKSRRGRMTRKRTRLR